MQKSLRLIAGPGPRARCGNERRVKEPARQEPEHESHREVSSGGSCARNEPDHTVQETNYQVGAPFAATPSASGKGEPTAYGEGHDDHPRARDGKGYVLKAPEWSCYPHQRAGKSGQTPEESVGTGPAEVVKQVRYDTPAAEVQRTGSDDWSAHAYAMTEPPEEAGTEYQEIQGISRKH